MVECIYSEGMQDFLTPRLIKKYPNRRLYDTAESRYVTLEDIKQQVLQGRRVRVVDARTQLDVTSSCLLQIILEQEAEASTQLFTVSVLENLIRLYEQAQQGPLSEWLGEVLELMLQQKQQFGHLFEGWRAQMLDFWRAGFK